MSLAQAQLHQIGGNQYGVTHGNDRGLYVEFRSEAVKQNFDSEQAGRPIFKNVDYIKIMFPGDSTKTVDRPVKMVSDESGPSDIERFPAQWQRYKSETEQVLDGTPITEWAPLTKADALMLKGAGIHTVEALAAVSDANLDNIGLGMRQYRDKAMVMLDAAKGDEAINKLYTENQSLRAEIDALKVQIAEIGKIKRTRGE